MQRRIQLLTLLVVCALLSACGGTPATITTQTTAPGTSARNNSGAATSAPQSTQQKPADSTGAGVTSAPAVATAVAAGDLAPITENARSTANQPRAQSDGAPPPVGDATGQEQKLQPTHASEEPSSGDRNQPPYDSTYYQNYGENPFFATEEDPLSTFAMDIDSASYTVMRRYLSDGFLPDPDSVRPEEYLNYFDYHYPQPASSSDFAIYTETGPSPWGGKGYEMVQIGIQGRVIEDVDRRPTSLTFVIDISGSMEQENRLATVKQSLRLLVDQMREDDQIGIVVYGSTARSVLPSTSGANKRQILNAIDELRPDGSTNVEAGLDIGFEQADEAFVSDNTNMILLCSDGVANNGVTDPEALLEKYKTYTSKGVKLSTFGFGMGNYNDILMERLANAGNGVYTYIDTLEEAERVFVQNLTGTLQLIARDAKVQVEFNPAVVSRYRLIGYENRAIADQDFRNDSVDAGEIGAGHRVTAIYEIKRLPEARGEIGTVRIRYHKAGTTTITEEAQAVDSAAPETLDETTPRYKLAVSVVGYAELLRHSSWVKGVVLEDVLKVAREAESGFRNDSDVQEFTDLLAKAADLAPNLPERTTSP